MFWKQKCCGCCPQGEPLAPAPPPNDSAHREFLYRAYSEFQNIIRFGDAKAAGVLVLLGLGVTDLIAKAPRLAEAYKGEEAGLEGSVSSIAFWLALPLAVAVVVAVSLALFPRTKAHDRSLFFFVDIQGIPSSAAYTAQVRATPENDLAEEVGKQVWQLSLIATTKMRWVKRSYFLVLAFLALWAVARVALFIAER